MLKDKTIQEDGGDHLKEKGQKKEINKQLILKALTDPEFRKRLEEGSKTKVGLVKIPELRLLELTDVNVREIRLVLAIVNSIDIQIGATADELLCANNDRIPGDFPRELTA